MIEKTTDEEQVKNENFFREIQEKADKEITLFERSSIDEIKKLNPKKNEKFEILVIETCPFLHLSTVENKKAIVFDLQIQGSAFDSCFVYSDNYGNDAYNNFENVKIVKRL